MAAQTTLSGTLVGPSTWYRDNEGWRVLQLCKEHVRTKLAGRLLKVTRAAIAAGAIACRGA